jgi:two-component system, NtrC family, nitrogen regulation response regulator GlnG
VRVIAATHQNLEERVRHGVFREDLFHRLNVIRLRLPPLRERNDDIPALARFFLQKSAKELGVEPKRITEDALDAMKGFDFPGNVRQLENICHWLTVMAPAQVIEGKDLPPELSAPRSGGVRPSSSDTASAMPGEGLGATYSPAGFASDSALAAAPAAPVVQHLAGLPGGGAWLGDLDTAARTLLDAGSPDVWEQLSRQFEGQLIRTALALTRGRRIEAAQKLGIGRNTITRKIQELGLED